MEAAGTYSASPTPSHFLFYRGKSGSQLFRVKKRGSRGANNVNAEKKRKKKKAQLIRMPDTRLRRWRQLGEMANHQRDRLRRLPWQTGFQWERSSFLVPAARDYDSGIGMTRRLVGVFCMLFPLCVCQSSGRIMLLSS